MTNNICGHKLKNNEKCSYKGMSEIVPLCGLHALTKINGNSKNTNWKINGGILLDNVNNKLIDKNNNEILKGKKYPFAFPLDKEESLVYLIMYTDEKEESINLMLVNKQNNGYPRKFVELDYETQILMEFKNKKGDSKFIENLNEVEDIYKNSKKNY